MSLIKFNDDLFPDFPKWNSLLDEFFDQDKFISKISLGTKIPAVNIKETEKNFEIEVASPGMNKEDFDIDLKEKTLTISAKKENQKEENKNNYTRREFNYSYFSRSFNLPEEVDEEKIEARYENGILYINLPKKEENKRSKKVKIN